jgi:branched-chain amino acid transport system permease protein
VTTRLTLGPRRPGGTLSGRRTALVGFAALFAVLLSVPHLADRLDLPGYYLTFLFTAFFWITQASSWNILTGYSGYFSFGQGAWFGVGVYTTGVLAGKQGWSFIAALPLSGLVALGVGVLLGLVVFRLRSLGGEIFALTTLAVAFVLGSVARIFPAIDGGRGAFMTGIPTPEILGEFRPAMYRMTLVIMMATVLVAYLIHESRLGWGLFSIRDDEQVARGLGVPVFRYKMAALGINAFFGGLMGGVWALQIGFLTVEDVFNIRVPLFVILMSVLGGTGHWMGPVVGAVIIHTVTDRFNSAGLEDFNQLFIGGLLVVLVLAVREGVYLRLRDRWAATSVIFGATIVGLLIFDDSSVIWKFLWGSLAVLAMALIPDRAWYRMTGRTTTAPAPEVEGAGA